MSLELNWKHINVVPWDRNDDLREWLLSFKVLFVYFPLRLYLFLELYVTVGQITTLSFFLPKGEKTAPFRSRLLWAHALGVVLEPVWWEQGGWGRGVRGRKVRWRDGKGVTGGSEIRYNGPGPFVGWVVWPVRSPRWPDSQNNFSEHFRNVTLNCFLCDVITPKGPANFH